MMVMMSGYWRSEVRIREFVTISQNSESKQSILNLPVQNELYYVELYYFSQQRLHLSTDVSRQNLSNSKHVCSVHALYVPHSQVPLYVCVCVCRYPASVSSGVQCQGLTTHPALHC